MTGAELIAAERKRQIEEEGWGPDRDDAHMLGELALAAACYASPIRLFQLKSRKDRSYTFTDPWPWPVGGWDKRSKHPKVRRLVIAGALIAAEIDRIQRLEEEESDKRTTEEGG